MGTLIISDDTETAAALARALGVFGHEQKRKPLAATGRLSLPADLDAKTVVIIFVRDELMLEHLIWGKLRKLHEDSDKDHCNPAIVLGFQKVEDFGKMQPVFSGIKGEPAALSHRYLPIPFQLSVLNKLIKKLEPVTDLAYINTSYANDKKYLLHRIHRIYNKNTVLSRKETIKRLKEVMAYFTQKGETENAERLETEIQGIPAKKWKDKTFELREMCEELLA